MTDVVAFQIVTVGDEATRRFEKLQAAGEYSEALYGHGLAVETAEAVAEWMHRRVRRELGLEPGRGKRYSWGFGACPDLEDHGTLFRILPAEATLGIKLTSAFQLAGQAIAARQTAIRTANMDTAWRASSAAAGALLMYARANEELQRLSAPPTS